MKTNLFLYLSAGFNMGALSTVLLKMTKPDSLPTGKEVATIVLSSLAAAATIGYALITKNERTSENEDVIDVRQNSASRLETFLV